MKKLSSYLEIRDWLESYIPLVYGKEELGLARIKELLKRLGNPENKFKSIHVAGTSGKGSTAFYVARLLSFSRNHLSRIQEVTSKKSTLKIGLHVSPHLVDIRERMQIFSSSVIPAEAGIQKSANDWIPDQIGDDKTIMPMERFIKLIGEVKESVEAIRGSTPNLTPSYFEILVAASFLYFAQEKVDYAVVEVGLGGRLDATNVLVPVVSVITNIGLDHTDILGKTVEKIAFEKAGIIKPGVSVVTAAKGKALEVIARIAAEKKAKIISNFQFPIENFSNENPNFKYCTQETVQLAVTTAEMTLKQTRSHLSPAAPDQEAILSRAAIVEAFSVGFAGRFEEIESGVLLDGAHNPDKIRVLIDVVKGSFLSHRQDGTLNVVLVLAFKKGKDWKKMVDLLLESLPVREVIVTQFEATTDMGEHQAVDPAEIAAYVKKVYSLPTTDYSNSQEAVFNAIGRSKSVMIVTGSLYLVGEVRTIWKD